MGLRKFLNPDQENQEIVLMLSVVGAVVALIVGFMIYVSYQIDAADPIAPSAHLRDK